MSVPVCFCFFVVKSRHTQLFPGAYNAQTIPKAMVGTISIIGRKRLVKRDWILLIVLCISAGVSTAGVNGSGASWNLSTTDLSSGTVQSNMSGGRLIAAGTPASGVVSTNYVGARLIIEPMTALTENESSITANFSATPLTGNCPLTVQFTDQSTGGSHPIESWAWTFGDGSPASFEQNPSHVYETAGSYTVSLTITTINGAAMETKAGLITAVNGVPAVNSLGLAMIIIAILLWMIGIPWRRWNLASSRNNND